MFHLFCSTPFPLIYLQAQHLQTSFYHRSHQIKITLHVLICLAAVILLYLLTSEPVESLGLPLRRYTWLTATGNDILHADTLHVPIVYVTDTRLW